MRTVERQFKYIRAGDGLRDLDCLCRV
jgi:hypothetical protein